MHSQLKRTTTLLTETTMRFDCCVEDQDEHRATAMQCVHTRAEPGKPRFTHTHSHKDARTCLHKPPPLSLSLSLSHTHTHTKERTHLPSQILSSVCVCVCVSLSLTHTQPNTQAQTRPVENSPTHPPPIENSMQINLLRLAGPSSCLAALPPRFRFPNFRFQAPEVGESGSHCTWQWKQQ